MLDASENRKLKVIAADGSTLLATFDEQNSHTMFSENVRMFEEHKVEFRDADISISSVGDGYLDIAADTGVRVASNELQIGDGTSNPGKIKFMESHAGQDGSVSLDAPTEVAAGHIVITLPSTVGNAGDVLQSDGSGNLSFVAQGGASNSVKTYVNVAGDVAANSNLSTDSGYDKTTSAGDFDAISAANISKALDVYVNGQLLQSGSGPYNTDISAASFTSGDYLVDFTNLTQLDVKFSFALEADDVVCIIGRA